MNKLTKRALTMVLVGSVTFPVTNALLSSHPFKRVVQFTSNLRHEKLAVDTQHSTTPLKQPRADNNSEEQNKAAENNQAVVAQISTMEVKNVQTSPSDALVALNASVKNVTAAAAIHINTALVSAKSTTNNIPIPVVDIQTNPNTTATTLTSSKSVITKATTSSSTTAKTTPTATTPTKTTTTTSMTNHGQQVSQAAKQKAANHQTNKVNNGKKKGNL